MKNPIDKAINFLRNEKKLISDNREAVLESNRNLFTVLMGCSLIIFLLLIIFSFFFKAYAEARGSYLIISMTIAVSMIIIYSKKQTSNAIYYISYGLIAAYSAFLNSFITPEYVDVIFLIFLIEISVIVVDTTPKLITYTLVILSLYLGLVIFNKVPELVLGEVVNTVIFAIIGSVTGAFFRTTRLSSMDLSRRLEIERKIDVLTGLYNRRMLFEYFKSYETGETKKTPYALAMIDIDDFKKYNDTYGHVAGDKCLGRVGECFKKFGEQNNITFYRYGGEEFTAIVKYMPRFSLNVLFTHLNMEIEALKISHEHSKNGYLTVSIGVTKINTANNVVKFEQRIDDADKALYETKQRGKGITVEYESEEENEE